MQPSDPGITGIHVARGEGQGGMSHVKYVQHFVSAENGINVHRIASFSDKNTKFFSGSDKGPPQTPPRTLSIMTAPLLCTLRQCYNQCDSQIICSLPA